LSTQSAFPYETPEDVKTFWLKWESHYKDTIRTDFDKAQEDLLVKAIQEDFDTSKIETVLDVGCGYGRTAKLLLEICPSIRSYDGLDISSDQLNHAVKYVNNSSVFHPQHADFETYYDQWKYDLVVCVETMTVLPYNIQFWIDRLVSLSKKYIISIDWHDLNHNAHTPISKINTRHDYPKHYKANNKIIWGKSIEIPKYTESIFLSRVR
jgi:SAM-dependent methyltransferase